MSEREVTTETAPPGVERIETELLDQTLDLERETGRLRAMGEPTRLTLLYLLAEEEQLPSGELAALLDRQQNDLYHHLNTLEEAGLVGKFREGNGRVYELSPLAEELVVAVFETIRERTD